MARIGPPADRPAECILARRCRHCGEPFQPGREWQRFCKPACRLAHFKTEPQRRYADPDDLFRTPFE